jgi:predicted nucleic acid-binding protein
MYLLDTNVISELRKPRPHGGVLAWIGAQPHRALHLSAVSIYELQAGTERTRIQDQRKADELDRWISELPRKLRVLPFAGLEARVTAYLMRSVSDVLLEDGMVAATAASHRLTVATRNTRDFEGFGVALLNPFEYRS